MESMVVTLCFVVAGVITTCYILKWFFLSLRGEQGNVEGITNKYVLITGCGSGFGKEFAMRLDQLGFRVIATCRTKSGEESVRAVCSNRVKTYCMDITDVKQVQEVYESIKNEIPADKGKFRRFLKMKELDGIVLFLIVRFGVRMNINSLLRFTIWKILLGRHERN